MSSGAASHKGKSIKPNVNANGTNINTSEPNLPTEADYSRDDQDVTPVNPAAMERPTEDTTETSTQK